MSSHLTKRIWLADLSFNLEILLHTIPLDHSISDVIVVTIGRLAHFLNSGDYAGAQDLVTLIA